MIKIVEISEGHKCRLMVRKTKSTDLNHTISVVIYSPSDDDLFTKRSVSSWAWKGKWVKIFKWIKLKTHLYNVLFNFKAVSVCCYFHTLYCNMNDHSQIKLKILIRQNMTKINNNKPLLLFLYSYYKRFVFIGYRAVNKVKCVNETLRPKMPRTT